MKTLIWKELRENLKWAILAMLVLAGAELYALHYTRYGQVDTQYNNGMTVAKDSFLMVTTFGCAIIGFLLGLIQIIPELPRDRWAALLHRPMPRGRILAGKIAAGLLLYLIAVVPPFLACVWQAATPGHFPSPFVPALALPGTADACAGLVYYFAGILVGLQRGGLVLLRVLPAFAAIHVSCFVGNINAFADAIWASVLMVAALGVAAWSAMDHLDSFNPRSWPGKIALLIVAFYGVCGLGDLGRFAFKAGDRSGYLYGVRYELSDTGRPLKVTYVDGSPSYVQELNGDATTGPALHPDRIRSHLRYMSDITAYIGDSHGWDPVWRIPQYRRTYDWIHQNSAYGYPRSEQWFYLVEQRTIIGMSPVKNIAIGRLDERGFQPVSATPVSFPPDLKAYSTGGTGYNLWTPRGVRYVDLPNRKIFDLHLPLPGPVSGVGQVAARDTRENWTVVALSTGLALYKPHEENPFAVFPYDQDVARWGEISVDVNNAGDRFYISYKPSVWISRKEKMQMSSYLKELNWQGEVLHSYTVPPDENSSSPRRWVDLPPRYLQTPAFFFGTMLYQKIGATLGSERLRKALAGQFGDNWSKTKESAVDILILSVLCAGVTFYLARRAQIPRAQAWAWTAEALLFNLAGLIVFRCVADWPRLVPCTACGKRRPVAHEHCPHCAQGWPPPDPNGTEILDYSQLNGFETTPTV